MTTAATMTRPAPTFSLLFGRDRPADVDNTPETEAIRDLHLDEVFEAACGVEDPNDLIPLCRYLLQDEALIAQRQAVFRDLARPEVHQPMTAFSEAMDAVLDLLRPRKPRPPVVQSHRMRIAAAESYCAALRALTASLHEVEPDGILLQELLRLLDQIIGSAEFEDLESATAELQHRLRELRFVVHLSGPRITVGTFDDEPNYESEVVDLFAPFHVEEPTRPKAPPRKHVRPRPSTDSVRQRIIRLVVELHEPLFADLAGYAERYRDFIDPTIALAHRELHFYLAFGDLMERLRDHGCPTGLPTLRRTPGLIADGLFDVALALRGIDGVRDESGIVANSITLTPAERLVVITGPNQGGKTTFSRAVGQVHHLAGIGCPVPGSRVDLWPAAEILTQFERAEQGHQVGKLEDDLLRIQRLLGSAGPRSVVVLNEIFSSTASDDAAELGRFVLAELRRCGVLCVYVTFLDELSTFDDDTVSLVAQVDPHDPAHRTFVVQRTAANGRAYAEAVAVAHGLDPATLRGRVA